MFWVFFQNCFLWGVLIIYICHLWQTWPFSLMQYVKNHFSFYFKHHVWVKGFPVSRVLYLALREQKTKGTWCKRQWMNKSAKSTHHQGRQQHLLIKMGWEQPMVGSFSVPCIHLQRSLSQITLSVPFDGWAQHSQCLGSAALCPLLWRCMGCQGGARSCLGMYRGLSWERSVSYFLRINKIKDRPFQKVL